MIEVGEYVKTHKGDIHKVIGIREEVKKGKRIYSHKAYYLDSKKGSLTEAFIIKHSKNLIDLIEEGDYVNGKYVYSIGTAIGNLPIINHTDGTFTPSNLIKSIVTKEMFASAEYRVETD